MSAELPDELRRYLEHPRQRRLTIDNIRAAAWVCIAYLEASRDLKRDGVRTVVRKPPRLPAGARRGVDAALRRVRPTCLQRSLIKQRWLVEHGVSVEVIIGVEKKLGEFAAHAWLDYETDDELRTKYRVIHVLPAPLV